MNTDLATDDRLARVHQAHARLNAAQEAVDSQPHRQEAIAAAARDLQRWADHHRANFESMQAAAENKARELEAFATVVASELQERDDAKRAYADAIASVTTETSAATRDSGAAAHAAREG